MDDTAALLAERERTHGDYKLQGALAFHLKQELRERRTNGVGNGKLDAHQIDALEMILVKVSRIACGNAQEPDHWDDIAGYARLGRPNSVNDM